MNVRAEPGAEQPSEEAEVLAQVRDAIRSLRYGQVTVVVHDSAVVQIDRLERRRVQRGGGSSGGSSGGGATAGGTGRRD